MNYNNSNFEALSEEMENHMKYNIGDIIKFKLTDQKAMILQIVQANYLTHLGYSPAEGYIIRLDNYGEIFAREMELQDNQ